MGFKLTTLDVRVQRSSAYLSTHYWNSLDIRWLIFVWTLNLVFLKGHTQCTKLPFCKVLESWLVGSLTPFFFLRGWLPELNLRLVAFDGRHLSWHQARPLERERERERAFFRNIYDIQTLSHVRLGNFVFKQEPITFQIIRCL